MAGFSLTHHPRRMAHGAWKFARAEPIALGAIVIFFGAVLTFLDLAEDMRENDGQGFDWRVLQALRVSPHDPIGPAWMERAAMELTALGGLAVLFVLTAIVVGGLLIVKRRGSAILLLVALAGGLALSETTKTIFERTRPPEAYRLVDVLNASFPSGHALLSTVFYFTLGAVLASVTERRVLRYYALGVAGLLAFLIGATRIYLGAHWASDVFAGWCLGAAWATLCWLAGWTWKRRRGAPIPSPETPVQPD